MNSIEACFTGRVTSDPESRLSQAGKPWLKFSAAVGEGETIQYCQVAVFGDQAAKLSGQINKGSKIYAEGRLKLDKWQKDGQERSGLSLAAWRCDLIAQIGQHKAPRGESKQSFPPIPDQRDQRAVGRDDPTFDDRLPF
ncbi:MAG: single-stranded DNA-binding protein [Rhodomicrobium sp.]